MMSNITELLSAHHEERINYDALLEKHPWINEDNRYCVLSPDSDGLLCGLFMAWIKKWKVVGFYDGKIAVINREYLKKDIVFLDGEIYRKEIKSFGHHMVRINKNQNCKSWDEFDHCIQPNNLRNYDGKHDFRLKYPLATIHMLVSIIAYANKEQNIKISKTAIPPLLFTDGVFNILFSYPENVLNWLKYLRIDEDWNPLREIFENHACSMSECMNRMDDFFRKRDEISIPKQRGDRLKISNSKGLGYNIHGIGPENIFIDVDAVCRIKKFIKLIGEQTTWNFNEEDWACWDHLKFYQFTKANFSKKTITNKTVNEMMDRHPLSWAMTSNSNIEYTLEFPDFLEINRTSGE